MAYQLGSSLDCLRSQQRTVSLFFRDDDVDEDEDSLRALLSVFLRHEVPVNLEIIPGRLSGSAVTLLGKHYDARPDLFDFNQHGWLHLNHEGEGRKCEFGPSRGFDEQFADIAKGKKVLEEAFGGAFTTVFTPPWNRCTNDTYRALDQLGFEAISKKRGKEPVTGYSFRELSVTLDLYRWKNEVKMKTPDEIIGELVSQIHDLDTIGVMLHHKVMDEEAFEFLELLLIELGKCRSINFHTLRSLLASMI